jgi:uncharacterized BrkB/YihY/UPF0761 family membrane protein
MAFVVANFFMMDRFENLSASLSVIYAGMLTIYAGTKEFDRWYDFHDGRHPGELFVIGWTMLLFVLFGATFFFPKTYHVASETIANYILVLTIFALTQKSKQMHRAKNADREYPSSSK